MTDIDEILMLNNTGRRRRNINDEKLLKEAEKLLYIESRVLKIPFINGEEEMEELRLLTNLSKHEVNTFRNCRFIQR